MDLGYEEKAKYTYRSATSRIEPNDMVSSFQVTE